MSTAVKSKPAFYLIALLIPVVLLVVLELGLRMFDYGKTIPAFIPVKEAPGYLQPNPKLIQRYFSSPELAPNVSPDTVYFKAQKPEDTFRIVIQGGSTAAGFPYGRFGSLQGMLQQRFKNAYPDKNIEIINTAMAAVNTFTLIDIQQEILALKPDAVLVYAGHNEYLGVLGAGSVLGGKGSYGATLLYLKLKSFRLFQLVESLTLSIFGSADADANAVADTDDANKNSHHAIQARSTMAKAAQGQLIPLNGEVYQQGVSQFKNNLELLLTNYKQSGVQVFVGNLVSIEKGLAPFSKGDKEQQAYQKAMQNNDLAGLQEARDLDQLRFRAPTEFNQIIADLADTTGAHLVDVETYFRMANNGQAFDQRLFLEHVHPTHQGYFLLGEVFYQALVQQQVLSEPFSHPKQSVFSQELAQKWQPLTDLDIRYANEKIRNLTNGYPFTDEPKKLQAPLPKDAVGVLLIKKLQGENWLTLQKAMVSVYQQQKNLNQAAKVIGVIADAMVHSAESQNTAAQLFREAQQFRFAYYHQKQALELATFGTKEYERYALNFAFDLFLAEQFQESLALLKKIELNSTQPKKVQFFIDKVSSAMKNKD